MHFMLEILRKEKGWIRFHVLRNTFFFLDFTNKEDNKKQRNEEKINLSFYFARSAETIFNFTSREARRKCLEFTNKEDNNKEEHCIFENDISLHAKRGKTFWILQAKKTVKRGRKERQF